MKKIVLTLVSLLSLAGISIGMSLAQNGHFLDKNTKATCSGESLRVCFKEAGLGNLPSGTPVQITLSGNATSLQQCFTKSGQDPQAENKRENVPFNSSGTFTVDKNGSVTGCLTSEPPDSSFSCPPGQVLRSTTTYTNIKLTDNTFGASTTVPGTITCSQ